MRIFFLLLFSLLTIALIIILDSRLLLPAPLGRLLSPQHGLWQNAEPVKEDFNASLSFPELKGKTHVYFDERLVPHLFAEQEEDAFFVQGYLHAKFRLWQMEFQTHAAAGRLSEVLGDQVNGKDVLNKADRYYRRLGLGYAAKKALAEAEKDAETKAQMDAYTAGVNAYIRQLRKSALPIEYKLLGYEPELWNNEKICLFLKYMSFDLAGAENDFEYSNAKSVFSAEDFEMLFPIAEDSLDPVVPKGTEFFQPAIAVQPPPSADSLYFKRKDTTDFFIIKPDEDNGSNNWAVSGSKTESGSPILCNDPHLGLNLPSIWYEMQINTPTYNAYGVSFPGAPYVIIGFNDSCAFGETNAGRDIRDYYEIRFKDESMQEYWFENAWKKTEFRYDTIKIKNKSPFIDTIAHTIFGPVMYDHRYNGGRTPEGKYYAVRWKAHDAGNELKTFNLLDRARNYNDYYNAIQYLHTPGQNFVFATKTDTIALWAQGQFPAKWRRQGDFIMPGTDSSYMWQGDIPQDENPHQINPERQFVSSANQTPADTSYPYYLGGGYPIYRGLLINRYLNSMQQITPRQMMLMQNDNYNVFAEMAMPVFTRNISTSSFSTDENKYWQLLTNWNLRNDPAETGATVFAITWDKFEQAVWADEYRQTSLKLMWPYSSTLLEAVLKDSAFKFIDDVGTGQQETLADIATAAFKAAVQELKKKEADGALEWASYKDTRVNHLLSLVPFSRLHVYNGGGKHMINATKDIHGPSWRMVVHLTPRTEAYGVYPGGQSGNPGSKYYDAFITTWEKGEYYPLWVMDANEINDEKVKWKMVFSKS
jgi:penicillin G amidase